jgi:hypothetical protein
MRTTSERLKTFLASAEKWVPTLNTTAGRRVANDRASSPVTSPDTCRVSMVNPDAFSSSAIELMNSVMTWAARRRSITVRMMREVPRRRSAAALLGT